jgi:hypothetical protein
MASASSTLSSAIAALRTAFGNGRDKYAGHDRARQVLQDMAASPGVFTEILKRHLARPDAFTAGHYPVVSIDIELNATFGLVANCWIPLPDANTDMSTKAIHHHGEMLLTTVTSFGPGYEHWQFTTPELLDASSELYSMRLRERAPHSLGHASFVDAHIPHVPFYPRGLTVTLALWTSRRPTGWKDVLKRVPALHKHSTKLRDIALSLGLKRALELKVAEYFDFTPTADGFRGMKDRREFGLGPNDDYLHSLFHVIQRTQNESLVPVVKSRLDAAETTNRPLVTRLLEDLDAGRPIEGRLSAGHYGIPFANFPAASVDRALNACAARAAVASM